MTQATLLPPALPPTNVNLSIFLQPNSAWVAIHFRYVDSHMYIVHEGFVHKYKFHWKWCSPKLTACSLQWPENFIVMVMQQGPSTNEIFFHLPKQTVTGMEKEWTLEKLKLRQKYQVSIKLEKNTSSSISEIADVCKWWFSFLIEHFLIKKSPSDLFLLMWTGNGLNSKLHLYFCESAVHGTALAKCLLC